MASVDVRGLRELELLAKRKGLEASKELNRGLRSVAEPMKHDVESLSETKISHMSLKATSKKWWKMRVGVTQNLVYIAPQQRGIKGRGDLPGRRRKFADVMQAKAMQPALTANSPFVFRRAETVMTKFVQDWNRS